MASDNRFYAKFMQLEKGLFGWLTPSTLHLVNKRGVAEQTFLLFSLGKLFKVCRISVFYHSSFGKIFIP